MSQRESDLKQSIIDYKNKVIKEDKIKQDQIKAKALIVCDQLITAYLNCEAELIKKIEQKDTTTDRTKNFEVHTNLSNAMSTDLCYEKFKERKGSSPAIEKKNLFNDSDMSKKIYPKEIAVFTGMVPDGYRNPRIIFQTRDGFWWQ